MYISRNQLPRPKVCDNCGSDRIGLTSNSVIYGDELGDWPYCYYCDECTAMVACHRNTHNPMGLMATSAIRRKRKQLHALFDPIWEQNLLSREDAYNWLGGQLHLTEECHISHLTKEQLKTAIAILVSHRDKDYAQFKRRKEKNASKQFNRYLREGSKIALRKSRY